MRLLLALLFCVSGFAQRFDVKSGGFEALKDIAEYNVTFDYDGMQIHGYESEAAFVKEKVEKRNDEKGEKFERDWYADRAGKYEPRFIEYFNSRFEESEVKATRNPQANHTMHVKTTWLYPGYGIGVGGEPAKISAVVTVFETANPSKILLSVYFDKAIGLENKNYNKPGDRISGAYEKLAKNLVMQIKRVL